MTSSEPGRASRQIASSSTVGDRDVYQTGEPIAIVGMAFRFPGAGELGAFWRLLSEGKNAGDERGDLHVIFTATFWRIRMIPRYSFDLPASVALPPTSRTGIWRVTPEVKPNSRQ